MRHLRPADYRVQPWANGRGQTIELWRHEEAGALRARLSMARVDAPGPFSLFPGIERNLTVIDGPGFGLRGEGLALQCAPLAPVAFPGDLALEAVDVAAPSDDFNVMTARALPRPEVQVLREADLPPGGLLALFALAPGQAGGMAMGRHDLLLRAGGLALSGHFLAVRLFGLEGALA